jgi:hypothetical protein
MCVCQQEQVRVHRPRCVVSPVHACSIDYSRAQHARYSPKQYTAGALVALDAAYEAAWQVVPCV